MRTPGGILRRQRTAGRGTDRRRLTFPARRGNFANLLQLLRNFYTTLRYTVSVTERTGESSSRSVPPFPMRGEKSGAEENPAAKCLYIAGGRQSARLFCRTPRPSRGAALCSGRESGAFPVFFCRKRGGAAQKGSFLLTFPVKKYMMDTRSRI